MRTPQNGFGATSGEPCWFDLGPLHRRTGSRCSYSPAVDINHVDMHIYMYNRPRSSGQQACQQMSGESRRGNRPYFPPTLTTIKPHQVYELPNISNGRRICCIYCKHDQYPPCFAIDTVRHHIPAVCIPNQCIKPHQLVSSLHGEQHRDKASQ